jgi:hypothetical protein
MIKLTNILNEITVNAPKEPEYKKIIRDYIRNGSRGNLDLSHINEKVKLPDNFTVRGDLDLYNTQITSFPNNLRVGGYLDLYNTQITSLPDNLKVRGYLNLHNTPITSLPNNLRVGGDLYLYYTPITSLPNNLRVGGDLDLDKTPLSQNHTKKEIRQMIEDRGGFIEGHIYI